MLIIRKNDSNFKMDVSSFYTNELSKEDLISDAILLRLTVSTSLSAESLLVNMLPPIFKIIIKSLINP